MERRSFFTALFLAALIGITACGPSKKAIRRQNMINEVVTTAREYTGTPYKYGGNSSNGIDCSALILNSYKTIDQPLPRSSKEQSKVGKKVKVKKLRSGDLVFFAMSKKRRKITHVGMVTEVDHNEIKFIHASTSNGVIETDLLKDYYIRRLRKARRVIK